MKKILPTLKVWLYWQWRNLKVSRLKSLKILQRGWYWNGYQNFMCGRIRNFDKKPVSQARSDFIQLHYYYRPWYINTPILSKRPKFPVISDTVVYNMLFKSASFALEPNYEAYLDIQAGKVAWAMFKVEDSRMSFDILKFPKCCGCSAAWLELVIDVSNINWWAEDANINADDHDHF